MDDIKEKFPHLPERLTGLGELAFNLWWCWHPAARMLFKRLGREAWKDSSYNPVKLLEILPVPIFEDMAKNADYLAHYDKMMDRFRRDVGAEVCWFTETITGAECLPIAYFSLEYGLHRSLPFYAGGLGFLAGDHLKECSDLGIPMVGVGFMYPDGYVRQKMTADGWQEGADERVDRDAAPITRVYDDDGNQLVVKLPGIDPPLYVEVWKAMVGRIPLYLMDTDLEQNPAHCRPISDHLYISEIETRLLQEMVLGIGGSAMLRAMGIRHSVLHLNEGHAAFAILERLRERMDENRMSFEAAVKDVRATTVFTTHTPVPAGHDVFSFPLMEDFFRDYYPLLGLDRDAFMQLGAAPDDPGAGFNMTAFALKMSDYHNGVSKRHGEVARKMWHSLWPDLPEEQVPIHHITNGVHVPTWIEPKMELLFDKYLGPDWLNQQDDPDIWAKIDDIPDEELWQTHYWLKMKLINRIREGARLRWTTNHTSCNNVVAGGTLFDPNLLTIGFARRMVTYKRADLIFNNLDRLKKLLSDPWRPIQIVFAGKAHPADEPAKQMVQRIFKFALDPDLAGRIGFVEDYGERLAQYLVHGVDVWLNNPLPPLEACGTSGMKATLNGVPQLSVLDGWWIEGFNGENGWAFGGEDAENRDAKDAEALYNILEQQVVPLYYAVGDDGIPYGWVKLMKNVIKSTAGPFSARRMVKEYSRRFYQPALKAAE